MKKIYVLGAGSSRFAGFPTGESLLQFLGRQCDLSSDFNVRSEGRNCLDFIEEVAKVLPPHRKLNGEPDLEFVLALGDLNNRQSCSQDRSFVRELEDIRNKLQFSDSQLAAALRGFKVLTASAFLDRSHDIKSETEILSIRSFNSIANVWTKLVRGGDILISFNWDLVQELMFKRAGMWTYEDGYGFQNDPNTCPPKSSSVIILKLHGSCNWSLRDPWDDKPNIEYIGDFFDPPDSGPARDMPIGSTSDRGHSLIIPSYLKDPSKIPALRSLWAKADAELAEATCLVVLGYSLPMADSFARNLFATAIERSKNLECIRIVLGGDPEGRRRWEDISQGIRVMVGGTFEDYLSDEEI